jgi:predicted neutral ceramidase superfamily lipid hydrolase
MLEALSGALAGILIAYFEKHPFNIKKVFFMVFLITTIFFWLYCLLFDFLPGKIFTTDIVYALSFGLFCATVITVMHLLHKWTKQKVDKRFEEKNSD